VVFGKIKSSFLYKKTEDESHLNLSLQSILLNKRTCYEVLQILSIGRGAKTLGHDLRQAGYMAVDTEYGDSNFTGSSDLSPPNSIQDIGFDMAISAESSRPFSEPSLLIKHAAKKLRPDGIFILPMPYHGGLNNWLISLREWWNPDCFTVWDGGYVDCWSKKRLTALLASHGFMLIETIHVRGLSLQWEAMILVARKARQAPAVGD
jgi:hypothetical protein